MTAENSSNSIDNKEKKEPKRKKSRVWRVLRPFVYLWLVVCVLLVWLVGTHSGLNVAFFRLPALFGVQIQAQESEGTFWRGFDLKNITINSASADVRLSRLHFDWHSARLFHGQLSVQKIDLGSIEIQSKKTTSPPKKHPAKLPRNVGLPFDVDIQEIVLNDLKIDNQAILQSLNLAYRYENNRHQLDIRHINNTWGLGKGAVQLNNQYPFALAGNMHINGQVQQQNIQASIVLEGSLKSPILKVDAHSQEMFLEMNAQVSPFARLTVEKINQINIKSGNFNPRILHSSAPQASLALFADIAPSQDQQQLKGVLLLSNNRPKKFNEGGLPFHVVNAEVKVDMEGQITIANAQADFAKQGQLSVHGKIQPNTQKIQLQAALKQLALSDLLTEQSNQPINGNIQIEGSFAEPHADWQLKRSALQVKGKAHLQRDKNQQSTVFVDHLDIQDGQGGALTANGNMALLTPYPLQAQIQAKRFNPEVISPEAPEGRVNGKLDLKGHLADSPDLTANLSIENSILSSVPLSAKGHIRFHQQHLNQTDVSISLGSNHINAKGSLGKVADRLNLDIDAPTLTQFGFGLAGSVLAKGYIAGDFHQPDAHLQGKIRQLAVRDIFKTDILDFDMTASPNLSRPLHIDIQGKDIQLSGNQINHIQLKADGSLQQHRLNADAAMNIKQKPLQVAIQANGGLDKQHRWAGTIHRLDVGGALDIVLNNPVQLKASADAVEVGSARWQILGGKLQLDDFQWKKLHGIHSQGKAQQIDLNQLNALTTLPFKHNVLLDADWQIAYNNNANGYLNIHRTSGDITILGHSQTLGLSELTLNSRLQAGKINNTLSLKTQFADGNVAFNIAQNLGDDIMRAPIDGHILLDSPDLAKLKPLLPIGLELGGSIHSDVRIGGYLSNPELSGPLRAEKLLYYDKNTGVRLRNGTLDSHFNGKKWDIHTLLFQQDNEGSLNIEGSVAYPNNIPDVNINVVLTEYPILNRPDQQVVLSGKTAVQYTLDNGLGLSGNLKLDKALFDFPKAGMPKLDDDIVVVGRKEADKSQAMPLNINLILDLNDAFHFSGKGLDVLMGGELNLQAKPKEEMRLLGTVKVVSGRYQAYGQDLEIEKGSIAFTGPVANPVLNIRAKRRNSQVGVGVDVTGTVNHPRANIFTDQPMSDKDKLSWLVLGRAASGESDNAALAAAAGTWLAGGVNDRIGLVDDIGLGSRQTRNAATGEMNPAEQMVTVGKHLTNRIYLGYEYGLSSTSQAVKLMYQLSKSIQVIGRVGSESGGGEVRYSKRFD